MKQKREKFKRNQTKKSEAEQAVFLRADKDGDGDNAGGKRREGSTTASAEV
jgi:hypothetical protein